MALSNRVVAPVETRAVRRMVERIAVASHSARNRRRSELRVPPVTGRSTPRPQSCDSSLDRTTIPSGHGAPGQPYTTDPATRDCNCQPRNTPALPKPARTTATTRAGWGRSRRQPAANTEQINEVESNHEHRLSPAPSNRTVRIYCRHLNEWWVQ